MRIKKVLTTFLVLVIIIVGVLWISKRVKTGKFPVASPTPGIEQQIESKFKGLTIPADTEKIELKSVSGEEGMGIATRNEILADLPNLSKEQLYKGWIENSSGKTVLLGTLTMEKGGWILNYDSGKYPGYNKVIVTRDGKHILEGSF